jgi:putative hydrolase of the HAD superfamily
VSRRIEAVVTDFGGVLTTPILEAFLRVQEAHGLSIEALGHAMVAATAERGENPLYALERGEISEEDFLRALEQHLKGDEGEPVSLDAFGERYFAHLDRNDRMLEYLRSLREERGIRLAILTNNVREWQARWQAMVPMELFETVVDSAFVGLRKPDLRIYELTLARLDLPAEVCAFVDDREDNCLAAGEVGLAPVRFVDTEQTIAELEALLGG